MLRLSVPLVDGKYSVFWCLVAPKATGVLALKVNSILLDLKSKVERNVNFYC